MSGFKEGQRGKEPRGKLQRARTQGQRLRASRREQREMQLQREGKPPRRSKTSTRVRVKQWLRVRPRRMVQMGSLLGVLAVLLCLARRCTTLHSSLW